MPRPPRCPIVTIDGPSGSGKGTISRAVAQHVGWHLLDSGALYRLVALAGVSAGAASEDAQRHAELAALLERQRAFAISPGLVADGRDMGTVVFPQADLKIFLTATLEERALRRHKQLKDKGSDVSLPALSREIAERDIRDQTRQVAPLRPAPDACVIDSTGLEVGAVVGRVLELGAARRLWR